MSENCPGCSNSLQIARDAEEGAKEERLKAEAGLRAAASERKRADRLEAKLSKQHIEAEDAKTIRACLAVWEEHCWAGSGKPNMEVDKARGALVREALSWQHIDMDGVCDSFRGVGLLPYRNKYNERSATPRPGFKRAADVAEALKDPPRLERFRDYYRRVQSTEVERRRESYMQVQLCADQHLAAFGEQARFEQMLANGRPKAGGSLSPSLIDRMQRALEIALGTSYRGDLRMLAMIASLVAEQSAWDEFVAPVEAQERGHLFVIEGGQAA